MESHSTQEPPVLASSLETLSVRRTEQLIAAVYCLNATLFLGMALACLFMTMQFPNLSVLSMSTLFVMTLICMGAVRASLKAADTVIRNPKALDADGSGKL